MNKLHINKINILKNEKLSCNKTMNPFEDEELNKIYKPGHEYIIDDDAFNHTKKYSLADLTFIVKKCSVSLYLIMRTQTLIPDFCAKYLLNPDGDYTTTDLDNYITYEDILRYQTHITEQELDEAYSKFYAR
jgi:hypothetical protein